MTLSLGDAALTKERQRSLPLLQQSLQNQPEICLEHRLDECCPDSAFADLVHGYQAAMAREKDHRNLASYPEKLSGQLGSPQRRHDLIHDYHIEPLKILTNSIDYERCRITMRT